MKRLSIATLFLLLLCRIYADTGETGSSFLELGVGGREIGMGETGISHSCGKIGILIYACRMVSRNQI